MSSKCRIEEFISKTLKLNLLEPESTVNWGDVQRKRRLWGRIVSFLQGC